MLLFNNVLEYLSSSNRGRGLALDGFHPSFFVSLIRTINKRIVITVPDSCSLLGSTDHNGVTAVRVHGEDGSALPAWGVQFHPESILTEHGHTMMQNFLNLTV